MVNEQDVLTGVEARRERQQQHERERERAQHGTSTTTTTTKTPSVTTTIPPLVAAITRALIAPLYFYFRTPVKLFRPPRLSSLTVIRALAVSEGRPLDWPYVRALIRKEGVAECGRLLFLPHHMLPPMLANVTIGLTLFTAFAQAERALTLNYPGMNETVVSAAAGCAAGLAQTVVAAPIDALKHGFNVKDLACGRYTSITDYVIKTVLLLEKRHPTSTTSTAATERGFWRAAYRGWPITAVRDGLGYALFFGMFTGARRAVRGAMADLQDVSRLPNFLDGHAHRQNVVATIIGGLSAAVAYQTVAFPLDVLHLQVQLLHRQTAKATTTTTKHGSIPTQHPSPRDILRRAYRGMGANITRGMLPTALALLCFELTLNQKEEDK